MREEGPPPVRPAEPDARPRLPAAAESARAAPSPAAPTGAEAPGPAAGLPGGPRERLFRHGAEALSEVELLALLFGSGSRGCPAVTLGERLFTPRGLAGLAGVSPYELCAVPGIGPVRAAQVIACFELGRRHYLGEGDRLLIKGPEDVHAAAGDLRTARKEHFLTFYLNARNQVIVRETVSIGSLNASIVHPREVFEPAVRLSAASVILAHNHPSGETDPSDDDLALTRRLVQVGELLGIPVVDHIIVGRRGYTSLRQQGFL